MKKSILFFVACFPFLVYSQINTRTGGSINVLPNSPTTNTNVGIGTNTPKSKLDIEGNVSIGSSYSGLISAPVNGAVIEGSVGIGTPTPTGFLDIRGGESDNYIFSDVNERNKKSLVLNAGSLVSGSTQYRLFKFFDFPKSNFNLKSNVYFGIEDRNDMGRFRFVAEADGVGQLLVYNRFQQDIFKVYDDGADNVTLTMSKPNSFLGIGTNNFFDGTDIYKLSVNGAVRAHRVKVYTTWADFVFEEGYQLPPLEEVEKHINEKGHLKDIPSAEEVEKNGIELGEMNKLLLQKIEELTLYMIELNKEIDNLKKK